MENRKLELLKQVADGIAGMLKELFGAEQVVFQQIERKTNNGSI